MIQSTNPLWIREIEGYHSALLTPLNKLLCQLDPEALPLTKEKLKDIIADPNTHLLLAYWGKQIVGMTLRIMITTLSLSKAQIEDVVADSDYRRLRIGETLTAQAIKIAVRRQAQLIDLTSNPSRPAAHRLYEKFGFKRRDTNVFRLTLS